MMAEDRDARPTVQTIASEIAHSASESGRVGEFCGVCCRGGNKQFVEVDEEIQDDLIYMPDPQLSWPGGDDMKIIRSTEDQPVSFFSPSRDRPESRPSDSPAPFRESRATYLEAQMN